MNTALSQILISWRPCYVYECLKGVIVRITTPLLQLLENLLVAVIQHPMRIQNYLTYPLISCMFLNNFCSQNYRLFSK